MPALGLIVILLGALAGGWWLAQVVESPAQREANAAPPAPGPLFADVTRGDLSDSRTIEGEIVALQDASYVLPTSDAGVVSVVTGVGARVGDQLAAGDVISEVNGRPVFAVVSPFAFYRDLELGIEGPDVRKLQETLDGLGLLHSAVDGAYGPRTAAAVGRLYRGTAYSTPTREYVDPDAAAQTTPTQAPADDTAPASAAPTDAVPTAQPKPIEYPYVPVSEILAIDPLPAQILHAPLVGQITGADGATLRLGSVRSTARFAVPDDMTDVIAEGTTVMLTYPGGEGTGRVSAVYPATSDGSPGPTGEQGATAGEQLRAEFDVQLLDDVPFPPEALGGSATVTVIRELIAEESLLVPTSAVVQRSDGDAVVVAQQADGMLGEIAVQVLGSLYGRTAVTPVVEGTLSPGDSVRVG